MTSRYENLVNKHGEEYAIKEMARISSFVKIRPGGAFNDPDFARKAQLKSAKTRKRNKLNAKRKRITL